MRVSQILLFLILSGCGLESSIPGAESEPSETSRAVTISDLVVAASGSMVTCEINEALIGPGIEIPIFIEFEGLEIERTTMENQATFTFSQYNPPHNGNIVCVVEYADAEFESESRAISPVD